MNVLELALEVTSEVAVTVIIVELLTVAGAVYKPEEEIVPVCGVMTKLQSGHLYR